MFNRVQIHSASEAVPPLLNDFSVARKQLHLLALTEQPLIRRPRGDKKLEIIVGRDTLGIKMTSAEGAIMDLIDVKGEAGSEWTSYVDEHHDLLTPKTLPAIHDFLASSFGTADAIKVRPGSIALGVRLGEAVEARTGLVIDGGPSKVPSIKLFEQIARGLLLHQPCIQRTIDDKTDVIVRKERAARLLKDTAAQIVI